MARHDPITADVRQAHAANRLAIARARQEAVLKLRAEGAEKRQALAKSMADDAAREGRRFDFDAYCRAAREIDAEYTRREIREFGLPVGAIREGCRESRDPVFQPGNASLRYWGRV
ncbi:MAG TPA: hypothetical protein PKD48_01740 [Sphingopyxis sp.]|nr:hypothetical protein [Sphingopyxis sp.]